MALLKETNQFGCVPSDKSIQRENGKLGLIHTVKFLKATMRPVKIRERQGPSQRIIQKCERQKPNPWAPKLEKRTQDETLNKSGAPAETHGN